MKEIKISNKDTLNKILNLVLTAQSQEIKLIIEEPVKKRVTKKVKEVVEQEGVAKKKRETKKY